MKKTKKISFILTLAVFLSLILAFSVSGEGALGEDGLTTEGFGAFTDVLKEPASFLQTLADGKLALVYSILLMIAVFLMCFWGYGFLKYCIGLSSFAGAIFLTFYFANEFSLLTSAKAKAVCILASLVFAILASFISFNFPKAGAFFFTFCASYFIFATLKFNYILAIAISLAVGIIAALFLRVAVIVFSSFVGGMIFGALLCSFVNTPRLPYLYIPMGMILFIIGMSVQFTFCRTKRERKRENRKRAEKNYRKHEEYEDEDEEYYEDEE